MTSRKKLILAISSFSLVFVSVIVAVVAIFAAQRQGVQTTFRISYTAKNVAATVQANYTVGTTTTAMHTDAGEEELVFLPEMAEGTGKLSPDTDNIDMGEESVVYLEYIFANDSDTVDVAISLNTSAFELNNMRVSYAYSYSRVTEYATMPTDDSFEPMMILGKTDEDGEYATLYVYMKIEVYNIANDASFTGNIVYNLDRATPVKLSFDVYGEYTNDLLLQTRYIPSGTNINDLPILFYENISNDGYVWVDSDLVEPVSFPINTTSDLTLYNRLYYAITSGNKQILISNIETWGPLYIKVPNGTRYSYGESIYTVTNGEYLILEEWQTITIYDVEKASASRVFTVTDFAMEGFQISGGQPKDLEEKLFYAAYGEYPQTYVGNELNETLKGIILTETGKSYNFFVQNTSCTAVEYEYAGKCYAKITFGFGSQGLNFANGEPILENEIYFFNVEPIVARAMQKNVNGTYTMMALEMMGTYHYNEAGMTDWKNTDLREYLNNTFAEESGLSSIVVTTTNQNDVYGDVYTNDDVWVVSPQELLYWTGTLKNLNLSISVDSYYDDANNSLRLIKASDFAMLGCASDYYQDGYTYYYLRSLDPNSAYCVSPQGYVYSFPSDYPVFGFIPVFAVNI